MLKWIRDKWVRFKKWIIALFIGSAAIASFTLPLGAPNQGVTPSDLESAYNNASSIKTKYVLDDTSIKIPAKNKNDIETRIGSSTLTEFIPELEFTRWNKEVKFKLGYDLALVAKKDRGLTIDGNKVTYTTPRVDLTFYDLTDGYEFELILKERPSINTLSIPIETENLEFSYQPELTPQEIDGGAERPENVVGSYAVYYKGGKSGDFTLLNGMNYQSGKAFHIYRPEVTDANGSSTWAILNINLQTKRLTLTVPQYFLDNATYPVIVDPTFGYTTNGASNSSLGSGVLLVTQAVLTQIASTSHMVVYNNSSNETVKAMIYNESGDYPSALQGSASAATAINGKRWNVIAYSSPINLTAGEYYLGIVPNTSNFNYSYDTTGTSFSTSSGSTYYTSPPATYPNTPSVASSTSKLSYYAVYHINCSPGTVCVVQFVTNGFHSWTVPTGVTSIDVSCVGGGGGGGDGGSAGGCGGGGGAFSSTTEAVSGGTSYNIFIGSGGTGATSGAGGDGATSTFATTTVVADGGGGGGAGVSGSDCIAVGRKGLASLSTGTTKYDGGQGGGGTDSGDTSGGGGGAGGTNGAGVNGTSGNATIGGAGGAGNNSQGGTGGSAGSGTVAGGAGGCNLTGGGGGGGGDNTYSGGGGGHVGAGGGGGEGNGGYGGNGYCQIIYTVPSEGGPPAGGTTAPEIQVIIF